MHAKVSHNNGLLGSLAREGVPYGLEYPYQILTRAQVFATKKNIVSTDLPQYSNCQNQGVN